MTVLVRVIAACVTLSLAACAPTPQILKRYDTAAFPEKTHQPTLSVSTFTVEAPDPPSTAPKLSTLSDRGQAAFIEAAAAKADKIGDLKAAITKPFASPEDKPFDTSRLTFTKRLVITLRKDAFRPADRLSEATVTITMPPRVRVLAWERLENDYVKVDQGELSLQQGNKFDVSTGITIPGASFLKPIDVSAEKTNTLGEKQQLVTSFIRFAGELTDHTIKLYQQADTQIDIGGTVAANLKLTFEGASGDAPSDWIKQQDVFAFKDIMKDNKPAAPNGIEVSKTTVRYANCKGGISPLSAQVDYTVRVVEQGDATINEGDDAVTFKEASATADASALGVLIQPSEKRMNRFRLFSKKGKYYLNIVDPGSTNADGTALTFDSYAGANEFLTWLRLSPTAPQNVGAWKLVTSDRSIPPTNPAIAQLDVIIEPANDGGDDCSAS